MMKVVYAKCFFTRGRKAPKSRFRSVFCYYYYFLCFLCSEFPARLQSLSNEVEILVILKLAEDIKLRRK